MKRSIVSGLAAAGLLVATGVLLSLSSAADPPAKKSAPPAKKAEPEGSVAKFMRAKLASSQSVLEGLVTENFDLVQTGAQQMVVMSQAAEWSVVASEEYRQDSAQFHAAAQDLIRRAKDKNVDGATLSYLRLTMSCIECHNHVRKTRLAAGQAVPEGLQTVAASDAAEIARALKSKSRSTAD